MNTKELLWEDIMTGHLVAGRRFSARLDDAQVDALCQALDALAERLRVPLVALVHGMPDYDPPGEHDHGWCIGVLVATADCDDPVAVAPATITDAVTTARALPWDDILTLLPAPPAMMVDDGEVAAWLLAVGGGAGAKLAYGVLFDGEDEAVLDEDSGLAEEAPGLDVVRGSGLAQDLQERATYGVEVAGAYFCGREDRVDLSPEAHHERVASLGALADRAAYTLMTWYD